MKNRKVCLIGCGSVGMAFLYGAMNQGLFNEYVLIDHFNELAQGNAIDCSDAIPSLPFQPKIIKNGTYSDCSDADIIVITAGVPQQPGETRINLISRNSKIIQDIAKNIKASGFDGITIIASNPVDIITTIYQKVTNFNESKVIGTGTSLDSARFVRLISEKTKTHPSNIDGYIIGEHGDTSVALFSLLRISGLTLKEMNVNLTEQQEDEIQKEVINLAYKIINLKKATYYGIGAAINNLCRAVLEDSNKIFPISCISQDSLGLYIGWPAMINKDGWHSPLKLNLNSKEKQKFDFSCKEMKKVYDKVSEELSL